MRRLVVVRRDPNAISAFRKALLTAAAVLLSLVVPGIVIAILGYNPLSAYRDLVTGSVGGSFQIGSTLLKFSPLLTASVGVAITFRAGLWNIGNLGQFLVGSLGAVLAAIYLGSFSGAWLLALAVGCLAGALWALLPGLLRVIWSINEVITTLMMNYIGVLLIDYLVTGPMKDPATGLPQTQSIPDAARLPALSGPSGQEHIGVIVAILLAVAFQFILFRTTFGYDLRVVGKNPRAAEYSGIPIRRTLLAAMLISGALSGLAGAGEVLGLHYRLLDGIAGGYEYTPIVVALLGELSPAGILIPAFVYAGLLVGGQAMQIDVGVPTSFVETIQALIVLFVIALQFFNGYTLAWQNPGSQGTSTVGTPSPTGEALPPADAQDSTARLEPSSPAPGRRRRGAYHKGA